MVNAVQVASLYATLEIRDALTSALNTAKSSLRDFGSDLKSVGGALTSLGAPFLALGALAVKAASDSEDALAQLDAVLKSTGGAAGLTRDELIHMASAMQSTTRYSDEATLSAESMLLTFTNVGRDVFPRALRATTNLSTSMKQDLKSSVVQLGKALNDPIAGITALTRVGVTFTQQQKDQIKAMVEAGDVMGAQTLILNELDKEFGGSAVAAGQTFAGSLDILKNRFDDVLEVIGAQLIPIIQQFAGWIGQLITGFQGLDPGVQHAIVLAIAFAAGLAVIGPVLIGIGAAISAIGVLLAGPFLPIALIVGGLILLAQHFGITFEQIQVYLSLIKLYAEYYFQGVVTAVQGVIDKVGDWINQNPDVTAMLGALAGATGLGLLIAALTGPVGLVVAIGAAIAVLSSQPGGLGGALSTAATAAQQLIAILGMKISSGIQNFIHGLTDDLHKLAVAFGLATDASARWAQGGSNFGGGGQSGGGGSGGGSRGFGFAAGGYTGNAPADQPVGVVHGREWVVPQDGALVLRGGESGITINGLTINANTAEGGRAAADSFSEKLRELRRERG